MQLSREQLQELREIYVYIISRSSALIELAGARGISIREAYESVAAELSNLDQELKGAA